MSRVLSIIRAVAFATYKEWAAYRSHMAASLLVGPVYFLVQYFIWNAVYQGRETLNGFTLQQMLTYYGVTAVIHYLTFDFADWNLQMLVRTGRFVTFALRPMPHWLFALAQKIGHRTLALWLEFVPILLLFTFAFGVDLVPAAPGWAALSLALSFLTGFLINYCVGLTAFWLVRAEGVRRVLMLVKDVSAGMIVPLTFFPEWAQRLFFILPFQYVSYAPARVYIGEYELAGIRLDPPAVVGLQACAAAAVALLMLALYRAALRRFTGVGV